METWLIAVVVVLLGAVIGVQVYYLRGLTKAGVEISRATWVVSLINIGLLALIGLGLLGYSIYSAMGA